jgi:hypothetical protein
LAITTTSLVFGVEGTQYIGPIGATGGKPPYQWSITDGALPAGLELAVDTGVVFGTPAAIGTFNFTATVTDSAGHTSDRSLSLKVYGPDLQVVTASLPAGVRTWSYSTQISAAGGVLPYSFAVSGLPVGLALDPDTGVLSGTPAVKGTFLLNTTATDSRSSSVTNLLRLVIIDPTEAPRISNVKLKPNGKLIVTGRNFDPLSSVMIDGLVVRTIFVDSGGLTVKGITLAPGDHEIRVLSANGIVSEPATIHR